MLYFPADVVWYKNDKLVMNTENLKVRIMDEEKKTALIVKHATEMDDATYVCKATSEIGLATTKARLHVTGRHSKDEITERIKEYVVSRINRVPLKILAQTSRVRPGS